MLYRSFGRYYLVHSSNRPNSLIIGQISFLYLTPSITSSLIFFILLMCQMISDMRTFTCPKGNISLTFQFYTSSSFIADCNCGDCTLCSVVCTCCSCIVNCQCSACRIGVSINLSIFILLFLALLFIYLFFLAPVRKVAKIKPFIRSERETNLASPSHASRTMTSDGNDLYSSFSFLLFLLSLLLIPSFCFI